MISGTADPSLQTFGQLKARVVREANEFAESKGMIAVPYASKENASSNLFVIHSLEYQFRVLDKNDPEARKGGGLIPRADFVFEKNERSSQHIVTEDVTAKTPDLYSELTKLDDLRKRGIITDAEFETQKQKLLNRIP